MAAFQNLVRGLLCIIFQVTLILSWEKQKEKNLIYKIYRL